MLGLAVALFLMVSILPAFLLGVVIGAAAER
jgi:hypothetical protein